MPPIKLHPLPEGCVKDGLLEFMGTYNVVISAGTDMDFDSCSCAGTVKLNSVVVAKERQPSGLAG